MATVGILSNFRTRNSFEFQQYVQDQTDDQNVYVYIGRSSEWPDDENPPQIQNTQKQEVNIWNDINGIKKISETDVTLGFRKIDWNAGSVYSEYDDQKDQGNTDFVVFTDENKVYKCISNNNGATSTIKPTHTTYAISNESDGYRWKYMFTIPESVLEKFITADYLPLVTDNTVINYAVPGTIDNIKITESGTGYVSNASIANETEIPIFVQGDGDQNSTGQLSVRTDQAGEILSWTIINGGSNYPYAPEDRIPIAVRQITASGITQTAYGIARTNTIGQIDNIEIILPGSGYVNGVAQIVQSSCRAYAETNFEGNIVNADIFTGREGANFHDASAILISESGSGGVLRPVISPKNGHGSDPISELYASNVMINLRLSGTESFLDLDDFRRIGLIENPAVFGEFESDGNFTPFTEDLGDAKYRIQLDRSTSGFIDGEVVYGETSGALGTEMTLFEEDKIRVKPDRTLSSNLVFQNGETVRGLTSGETGSIINISEPDIEPFVGEILYINNREPVVREADIQLETVTVVLQY